MSFKIASWNVNSLKVRLPHVSDWLTSAKPDVLALQETKSTDENFPVNAIEELGYQVSFTGQKTYNGVAIISKSKQNMIANELPVYDDPQKRVLACSIDDIIILDLYVPNGSEVDSEKYRYKLEWFSHLHPFVDSLLEQNSKVIILGDFNIAPEDKDVHDPAEWEGSVLVSDKERAEFRQLIDKGFVDTFRLFEQADESFSWWDYRAAAFRRNRGLRIDHVLASRELQACCIKSYIDKEPRKLERPSDHTPVVAEFDL
ncbi:MAG: exodeoxyribonuclease III [Pseudomonadota bacterium]